MSNLACRFITRGNSERNAKLGQRESGRGHVTDFRNFGTPPYLGNGWGCKRQIWHPDLSPGVLTKEMQN